MAEDTTGATGTAVEDTDTDADATATEDRDIDTLLKLDRYDGLTDGEVRKLLKWNGDIACQQAYSNYMSSASKQAADAAQKAADVAWQNAQAAFTNACAISPDFKTLSDLGVTNG